jgi:hypothetical protein
MTKHWKTLLGLTAAATLAVGLTPGQEATKGKAPVVPKQVFEALPKAEAPASMRNLGQQAQGMIAVRDAETGELRAATAEEHASVTRSRARAATRAAAGGRGTSSGGGRTGTIEASEETIALPDGGIAVRTGLSQMEFLTAQRQPDGSIKFVCGNPLHKHEDVSKSHTNKGERANEQ